MTRRDFALSFAAALPLAICPAAFAAETMKERGRRLISRTVAALGGEAFRTMRTRTESGRAYSFYHSKLTGLSIAKIYTKYLTPPAAPAHSGAIYEVEREAFGKKQDDAVIFTAKEAFEVTYRGAKPLGEEREEQFRNTTLQDVFYILRMRFEEPGLEFEGHGADVVENQPVEIVEIFDAEDRNVTLWIHADTFLPVKQRYRRWDPVIKERREEVTHFFSQTIATRARAYSWPHVIEREQDTEKTFELYSDRVTVNDNLPRQPVRTAQRH